MIIVYIIYVFILLGIIGGLLGVFYRNCLVGEGMILNFMYYGWLKKWAEVPWDNIEKGIKSTNIELIKSFVAYPLGYCIYCSTTWITIFLCIIYLSNVNYTWQEIVIGLVTARGVQHILVCIVGKFVLHNHPDLDV